MPAELTFVEDALIRVAPDTDGTPGTFATVMNLTDYSVDRGGDDDTDTFFFGEEDPHTSAGDDTDTYELSGAYAMGDTTGQDLIRAAKTSKAHLHLQSLPDGENGEQQKVRVVSYNYGGARNGGEDFNTFSCTLRGVGAVTTVTAA